MPAWNLGKNHSPQQWATKLSRRGWTSDQIDEAINRGQQHPAPNRVIPGHAATRYLHPTTLRSIVLDEVTAEVIHVGGDCFVY